MYNRIVITTGCGRQPCISDLLIGYTMFFSKAIAYIRLTGSRNVLVIIRRPRLSRLFHCSVSQLHMPEQPFQTLAVGENKEGFIAYRKHTPINPSEEFGIIFCQGLLSNMNGTKAKYLEQYCKEKRLNYVGFDYMGHGQSSGKFENFTISLWRENVLEILDKVAEGPQIIVGSSIGGWIMLLAALANPSKVQGLIGIAAAPDLLYHRYKNLPDKERYGIENTGNFSMPSEYWKEPYILPFGVITDAKKHLLLNKSEIDYNGPVHLIHGMDDETVPFSYSLKLCQRLKSKSTYVHLIKEGDHRLSRESDLLFLGNILDQMIGK